MLGCHTGLGALIVHTHDATAIAAQIPTQDVVLIVTQHCSVALWGCHDVCPGVVMSIEVMPSAVQSRGSDVTVNLAMNTESAL